MKIVKYLLNIIGFNVILGSFVLILIAFGTIDHIHDSTIYQLILDIFGSKDSISVGSTSGIGSYYLLGSLVSQKGIIILNLFGIIGYISLKRLNITLGKRKIFLVLSVLFLFMYGYLLTTEMGIAAIVAYGFSMFGLIIGFGINALANIFGKFHIQENNQIKTP